MQKPTTLVTESFRLTEGQKSALRRLGIHTLQDLLLHFPSRYAEGGGEGEVAALTLGQEVSLLGRLEKLETKKSWKRRIPVAEGYLRDSSGRIKLRWFHQPYIAKMYAEGTLVRASGKVSGGEKSIYIANPSLSRVDTDEAGLFKPEKKSAAIELFAQYPESQGVSSLWLRHAIQKTLREVELLDPLPPDILARYHLPTLSTALVWIHTPQRMADALAARKRFAFEEVFLIQLERGRERALTAHEESFPVGVSKEAVDEFMKEFPFSPTRAQQDAVEVILKDMRSGHPMSRLLEGDVGSGKTAVAATASYATVRTRPRGQDFGTLQVAYMAPTEILAKQHFESFIEYFASFPISIGLITGSGCYKFPSKVSYQKYTSISRTQLLKWVGNGEIPILIGTHALIEKSVRFKHLALVVIDEQHRFGTNQRKKLARKEARIPHLLSMTATPIPRTLALTLYGDLDLTLLDELPPGRKKVITEVVAPGGREKAYEKMQEELRAGRQAYVICPRIEEPDPEKAFALQAKSVKAEAKRLSKEIFPAYRIGILHSKMRPQEKEKIMREFLEHQIDILVATSVVEVGVNVPNATMIFIEGAERFGLSQLHQLRGRVIRSAHQAYCFMCPESKGEGTMARLKALVNAKNGFELAEQDLLQRGPGELSGRKQWGISDIGMEALKNLKLVEAARQEALTLIQKDMDLKRYPLLREAVGRREQELHFE